MTISCQITLNEVWMGIPWQCKFADKVALTENFERLIFLHVCLPQLIDFQQWTPFRESSGAKALTSMLTER
uniref:Uncharacterized protein n=1 Tax=Meloidogyne incognita TaxID=6306 RepID=A0A914KNM1_MELIC